MLWPYKTKPNFLWDDLYSKAGSAHDFGTQVEIFYLHFLSSLWSKKQYSSAYHKEGSYTQSKIYFWVASFASHDCIVKYYVFYNPHNRVPLFYLGVTFCHTPYNFSSLPHPYKSDYNTRLVVKPESEVPKSKVSKSRQKGLGLTLKSHGPPPPQAPPTFKHEGKKVLIVTKNDPLDSSSPKNWPGVQQD